MMVIKRTSWKINRLPGSVARFHISRVVSKKLTEHEFDDAELMSSRLTSEPYYAKRHKADTDEVDESGIWENGDKVAQKELQERFKRLEAIRGIIGGLGILGLLFGGFTLYVKWPALRDWWYYDSVLGGDFKPPKKKKKAVFELPKIDDPNDSNTEGLYLWGNNQNYLVSPNIAVSDVRSPMRHPWFDNKFLKSVTLGEKSALAIDNKGNLIQWGKGFDESPTPKYTISGENLVRAEISNGAIYAMNRKNEILIFPESLKEQQAFKGHKYRKWNFKSDHKKFLKIDTTPLTKSEKIIDFQTGKDHFLALTNKGRAFSGATGFKEISKSQGQFGIPDFSTFEKPPSPNVLHPIELLNYSIEKNSKGKIDRIQPRIIKKVAVGNYHSMALDATGEVYTFGQNTYGQLGHNVTYETEFVSIPKKIELLSKHVKRDYFPDVTDIEAGGDTSFCTVKPLQMYKLIRGSDKLDDEKAQEESFVVGFGNNMKGQVGNGHYVHAQFDPTKVKELENFQDYDEIKQDTRRIKIKEWSSGQEHTFVKLENSDVLFWGGNDFGQLGNGKRNRVPRPTPPPALIEPSFTAETYKDKTFVNRLQLRPNQHIVAGETASAIFYDKLK